MDLLDESYWDNRYKQHTDIWDLGEVSPPIKTYFKQITDKSLRILIPGGGNSYEAEYLFKAGFYNVYVLDISYTALQNIKKRVPLFPEAQLIHSDFFILDMTFDIIIEQTFFCALNPGLRRQYVVKMNALLASKGEVVGLLFKLSIDRMGPPFGGSKQLYMDFFESLFYIKIMEDCTNSVGSRMGNELFFKMIKQ